MSRRSVTIKDVANKAGVSLATASRALSGNGYVSEDARANVQGAAKALGYKPSGPARSLKLNRTDTVGLMITDIVNPFYSYLADGVLDQANELGYHVILCATDEDPAMEREYLEVLMEQRVDGIVAVPTGENIELWEQAIQMGTELVLVDREVEGIEEATVVLVDNVQGSKQAVHHMIDLGHRRIAIVTGPTTTTTGLNRLQGYYDALEDANIPIDDSLVRIGTFKQESGVRAVRHLMELEAPPTAIFAANNALGQAAMFTLREQGFRLPEDISLVIFDNVPWTALSIPAVTVVDQPTRALGVTSMKKLAEQLGGAEMEQDRKPERIMLEPKLIIRDSCAPLVST